MKKITLFLLGLISVSQLKASHLMGGQITSKHLYGLTYEVSMTLYRDTMGIAINDSDYVYYSDTTIPIHRVSHIPVIQMANGVEKYIYVDTVTFSSPGQYSVDYTQCCRNATIMNLDMPGGYNLYLDNVITVDTNNSSPVFLNDPITVGQVGVPFTYNPLAYDLDGDSIAWDMDTPMDSPGYPIPGFYFPDSDTSMPFTLDLLTGEISFLPITAGVYQLSVKATEYRNGVEIGYIRRDMQLLITASGNNPLVVNTNIQVLRTSTSIEPGQTFHFTMDVSDPDSETINVEMGGDLLSVSSYLNYNSYYTINYTNHTYLDWTPSVNDIRSKPYVLTFRVSETYNNVTFYHDYTYSVRVDAISGVDMTIYKNLLSIYPNPVVDKFSFDYPKQDNPKIYMINSCGQVVMEKKVSTGHNEYDITDMSSGVYYVVTDNQVINDVIVKK